MPYLFDTNICSAMIRGTSPRLVAQDWSSLAISAVTAHELEFWAAATGPHRSQRVRSFLARVAIRAFDTLAATHAANVRLTLLAQPLSALDALIAGHALALGYVLATADADFKRVPGLRTENWLKT
jgi:tRNA(fMet)-specific endonuclease VapC